MTPLGIQRSVVSPKCVPLPHTSPDAFLVLALTSRLRLSRVESSVSKLLVVYLERAAYAIRVEVKLIDVRRILRPEARRASTAVLRISSMQAHELSFWNQAFFFSLSLFFFLPTARPNRTQSRRSKGGGVSETLSSPTSAGTDPSGH